MKILRIITSMDPSYGGPCQGIRNLVPELEKLGVYNEVVCLDNPEDLLIGRENFTIHALGRGKSPWRYNFKLIPWLIKNICHFDVVIVHGLWLYPGYAVRKALQLLKNRQKIRFIDSIKMPKLYLMPHGMLDPYFQKASGRKLKALRNWIYWKFFEEKTVNVADGILFTCEEELMLAGHSFRPYRPMKEINIGYGIADPPNFNQNMQIAFLERCPSLLKRPYLLFISRIHEKKGVDLLIKAYAEVYFKKEYSNDTKFSGLIDTFDNQEIFPALVIAGPGLDSNYGKRIQSLISKIRIPKDNILLPGMLSGDAKWGAFYGCEAFILPSHQENFGIAIVEAMACKKPVLISNQINIWREISGANAGIVENDTIEGVQNLLELWRQLSLDEKLEMGQQAQNCYKKNFSVRTVSKRLIEVLNI